MGSHFLFVEGLYDLFLFDFCYPFLSFFLPELFPFLESQSAGCPSFVSLLHGFWLNGFLFWKIMMIACLYDCSKPSLSFVSKGLLLMSFVMHLDQLRELPCPRLWLRVLIFENKTPTSLALMGWRGIIILITPVFRNWTNVCTSSPKSVQKHTIWD